MSRQIRVCALAPHKYQGNPEHTPAQCFDAVVHHWNGFLADAFALKPDLIVLPEACDRPNSFSMEKRFEYYEYRGDRMRDYLLELAVEHHCNIAYSAARLLPDGTYRNSTQMLSRHGKIDGIYDKNHLVPYEYTEGKILYGTEAPIIETDFGKVGGVICFDIHYDELREKYMRSRPEILLFSSNHHGCGVILNPVGKVLAESTYRSPYLAIADIDLDYRVMHWDENWPKLLEAQRKYGPDLHICEPDAHLGLLMITCSGDRISVDDVMREFELETWDSYYSRCVRSRNEAILKNR